MEIYETLHIMSIHSDFFNMRNNLFDISRRCSPVKHINLILARCVQYTAVYLQLLNRSASSLAGVWIDGR